MIVRAGPRRAAVRLVALGCVVAGFVVLQVTPIALASSGVPGTSAVSASPSAPATPAQAGPDGPVLFVGIPGLRWSDVSAEATPAIYQLLAEGSAGSLSVRTVLPLTCPADGWLSLGAGARAFVPRSSDRPVGCPTPEVTESGSEPPAARVAGYPEIAAANDDYSYDPAFGLLDAELRRAGSCATAVGPGAALALADDRGQVQRYRPDLTGLDAAVLTACPLTIVDLGSLPGDTTRQDQVREADRTVAAISAGVPERGTLVVAGIADNGPVPHLGAVAIRGPAHGAGWLTASSTRQDGLVQLTDLTPTVLGLLGLDKPTTAVGSTITSAGGPSADPAKTLRVLRDTDVAAQTIRAHGGWFFGALEGGQYLLYLLIGALAWWRFRSGRPWRGPVRVLGVLALFFGSIPAAGYLVNLLPWWRAGQPAGALLVALGAVALALTGTALGGPWRRHPFGPPAVLAAVTVLVLAIDVITGSRLQLSSLFGLSPLVAGRFYGFGNVAFAVFAMAALFTAAMAASALIRSGRRTAAVIAIALIGLAAVLVDGWQGWGADFGGVIAMVSGFAVLGLSVARLRLTPVRLAGVVAAAIAAVAALATADWLRPADQRSHLGRFVQQVLDGEAGEVVVRKADAMLASLTRGPEGVLVPIALIVVALAIFRTDRVGAAWLSRQYRELPALRAGLIAMLVTAVVAALVNDSGVQIPAVCLAAAVPWVLAGCARAGAGGPATAAASVAGASAIASAPPTRSE